MNIPGNEAAEKAAQKAPKLPEPDAQHTLTLSAMVLQEQFKKGSSRMKNLYIKLPQNLRKDRSGRTQIARSTAEEMPPS